MENSTKDSNHFYQHKGSILISKKCIDGCYHHVSINNKFAKMSKNEIRSLAKKKRFNLDKHFDIVKINILSGCLRSFPCKHEVSVNEADIQILSAPQIKRLYERFKICVPDHFKAY